MMQAEPTRTMLGIRNSYVSNVTPVGRTFRHSEVRAGDTHEQVRAGQALQITLFMR